MPGLPVLRNAIGKLVAQKYHREINPDTEVTVTSGATEALLNAIFAVVRPAGDEIVMLDPCYDSYAPAVVLAGGRPVRVPLRWQHDFGIDWPALEAAVSERTRLLIINTPHNPAGAILGATDMTNLAKLLGRHPQLSLLSDEVYEHIVFDGAQHQSILRHPALAERSFVISSFGKTYHCTGWKLGYCVAPPAMTAEFRKIHQFNTFASFTPVQHAVAEMLAQVPEHITELSDFYQQKRDFFQQLLRSRTLLKPLPVAGGFFQLVDYSAVSNLSDEEFCVWLTVKHGVTAIPLSPFYEKPPPDARLARFCFAKSPPTLQAAIERLANLSPLSS
jgi:methionine aminotransferase